MTVGLRPVMHMHLCVLFGECKYSNIEISSYLTSFAECSEVFGPDFDVKVIPPWQFLPSPRNITIERGWRTLMEKWGNNILHYFFMGRDNGWFHANNDVHV